MLEDFFVRALLAGLGVAVIAGPLGCFVVWRRLAYFGDTLAHAALLGIALGLLLELNLFFAVFFVAAVIALSLLALQRHSALPSDALLGLLSHGALALGLTVLALMTWVRVDLPALLFGDILAISVSDLAVIGGVGVFVLATLLVMWRQFLTETLDPDLAEAEGLHPRWARLVFLLLLALMVALTMRIVGVLLTTALLIIPAATARRLTGSPEAMAVAASAVGCFSVIVGLFASLHWDLPSGPLIVVVAFGLFLVSLVRRG